MYFLHHTCIITYCITGTLLHITLQVHHDTLHYRCTVTSLHITYITGTSLHIALQIHHYRVLNTNFTYILYYLLHTYLFLNLCPLLLLGLVLIFFLCCCCCWVGVVVLPLLHPPPYSVHYIDYQILTLSPNLT